VGTAQIQQSHTDAQQPHRLAATGKRLSQQLRVAAQIPPGTRLFQCGLGEIMKLHLHERLAWAVLSVHALDTF
jgi:hypothetical protein